MGASLSLFLWKLSRHFYNEYQPDPVIPYSGVPEPTSVIPYSEVTNEIGNLLPTRCRVIVVVL